MTRASEYSFMFHVALAAFVSGATIGFLRPDFPAELTQATARASGAVSSWLGEPQNAPAPAVLVPVPEPSRKPAPTVAPPSSAPPAKKSPIMPAQQTLPPIDLEIMLG
jgi:hypothetical protein